jgi:hypothetical protein
MTRRVEVLAVDWERLRRAFPGSDPDRLVAECVQRGLRVTRAARNPENERGVTTHAEFADRLALLAVHRFDFAIGRQRSSRAAEAEQRTYDRYLELDRDVVPPLKEEAKALRAQLRRLEGEARDLGIDLEAVKPRIAWDRTLAVDTYSSPHYESNEARRQRTLEFFRRIRPE